MKALIIEDETAAALNLEAILKQVAPGVEVIGTLESVEESIGWLRANPQPDLLFMDIHLADGDSFRIFDAVEISKEKTGNMDEVNIEAIAQANEKLSEMAKVYGLIKSP